jgi:transcriptional regulator with XRE-family HTH domain
MLTEENVREMVLDRLKGLTQKELAEQLGVSLAYLNDFLHFRRDPGAKLLEGLGLRRIVLYERVEV